MVARLLQVIVIGWILLSASFIWASAHSGHARWGWLLALTVPIAHGWILAIEFALVAACGGTDRTPAPTVPQLLRAWCSEIRIAFVVFCYRQPFRSRRWADTATDPAPGRRGVVFVHGYLCNRGLWNPWLARLLAQGVPTIAVNLQPPLASLDEYVPIIGAAVRQLLEVTGRPPVIVAHSMGGLAVRRWWFEEGQPDRVHHVVTIGTPHRGTWLARYGLTANARQMRIGSPWLAALAASEAQGTRRHFTCFYSNSDNIVFPALCGTLAGADNRLLSGRGHLEMADQPQPWEELQRLLSPVLPGGDKPAIA